MHIDAYTFGRMIIDGTVFTSDLILYPDRIESEWWRRQGHLMTGEDIASALDAGNPDHLVVGTGKFGIMKIERELIAELNSSPITLHTAITGKAVAIYNRLVKEDVRVMGAFHLTC